MKMAFMTSMLVMIGSTAGLSIATPDEAISEPGTLVRTIQAPPYEGGGNVDDFGVQLVANEQYIVSARPGDDRNQFGRSSVYVFDAESGVLIREFTPQLDPDRDRYGASIAISGDLLAVGSPRVQLSGESIRGRVYLYRISTGDLLRTFNDAGAVTQINNFGSRLAMTDERLVVLSGGTFRIDSFDLKTGEHLFEIRKTAGQFGRSMVAYKDMLFVGTSDVEASPIADGFVEVYDITTGELRHNFDILGTVADSVSSHIGNAIDVTPFAIAIGDYQWRNSLASGTVQGAVHLFDPESFEYMRSVFAQSQSTSSRFGARVKLQDRFLAVTAPSDDVPGISEFDGSHYVFDAQRGTLLSKRRHHYTTGAGNEQHGYSIAASGNCYIIGNPSSLPGTPDLGSLRFYSYGAGAITFRTHPAATLLSAGQEEMTLNACAVSRVTVEYQWYRDGIPLAESERIQGVTSTMLRISTPGPQDVGNYRLKATTAFSECFSDPAPVAIAPGCPGDLDNSGGVDLLDLNLLLANFGANSR